MEMEASRSSRLPRAIVRASRAPSARADMPTMPPKQRGRGAPRTGRAVGARQQRRAPRAAAAAAQLGRRQPQADSAAPPPQVARRTNPRLELPPTPPSPEEVLAARRRHYGPNAALNYERPLHMVRGEGCHLWDDQGRRFLDCANNVAHLGHCHPGVSGRRRRAAAGCRRACAPRSGGRPRRLLPALSVPRHTASSGPHSAGDRGSVQAAGHAQHQQPLPQLHPDRLRGAAAGHLPAAPGGGLHGARRWPARAACTGARAPAAPPPRPRRAPAAGLPKGGRPLRGPACSASPAHPAVRAPQVCSGSEANDLALRICRWAAAGTRCWRCVQLSWCLCRGARLAQQDLAPHQPRGALTRHPANHLQGVPPRRQPRGGRGRSIPRPHREPHPAVALQVLGPGRAGQGGARARAALPRHLQVGGAAGRGRPAGAPGCCAAWAEAPAWQQGAAAGRVLRRGRQAHSPAAPQPGTPAARPSGPVHRPRRPSPAPRPALLTGARTWTGAPPRAPPSPRRRARAAPSAPSFARACCRAAARWCCRRATCRACTPRCARTARCASRTRCVLRAAVAGAGGACCGRRAAGGGRRRGRGVWLLRGMAVGGLARGPQGAAQLAPAAGCPAGGAAPGGLTHAASARAKRAAGAVRLWARGRCVLGI